MDRPSKYHDRVFVGTSRTPSGYDWSWNSSHPELEPTETFALGCQHYCSYCCQKAYPIQAGLRDTRFDYYDRDFTVTGYTCICEGAEKEKELRRELEELKSKHQKEEWELKSKYSDVLRHDKKTRLKMQYDYDLKELERHESSFQFK